MKRQSFSFCSLGDGLITIPVTPEGGTFSGPGMTGNQFDPEAAGIGDHVINYTVTLPCGTISDDITLFVVDCCPITNIDLEATGLDDCDPFDPAEVIFFDFTIDYTPDQFSSNAVVFSTQTGTSASKQISDPSGVFSSGLGVSNNGQIETVTISDADGHCVPDIQTFDFDNCGCGLELRAFLNDDIPDCPGGTISRIIKYRSTTPAEVSLDLGATFIPGLIVPSSGGAIATFEVPGISVGPHRMILRSTEDPTCVSEEIFFNVFVKEPLPICQDITVFLDENGLVGVDPLEVIDQTDPNYCPDWDLSVVPNNFDCEDVGPNTVSLTATADDPWGGEQGGCTGVVTVVDNLPPNADCGSITITFNGEEEIIISPHGLVFVDDPCGVESIELSPAYVTCEQVGQIVEVVATVTDYSGNQSTCIAQVSVEGLPCGFSTCPGHVDCADSYATFDAADQTFHLTGVNCFYVSPYNSDELAYIRHEFCGDGEIIAKLESVGGSTFGWAGISLRENCDPGSKKFEIIHNGSNLIRREARTTTDGYAFPQQYPIFNRRWFKLARQGNQFIAYISPNGVNWQFIGAKTIVMPYCIEAGLAVTNYQPVSQVTGVFSNVSVISEGTGCTACLTETDNPDIPTVDFASPEPEVDDSPMLNIFPNPSSGMVMVEFSRQLEEGAITVLDNLGRKVQSFRITQDSGGYKSLELSSLPKGVYFIRLQQPNGESFTERLILN